MPPPDSFSVGHEPDAMRFRWIVIGAATLIAVVVGTFVGVRLLLATMIRQPRPVDAPRSAVERVAPTRDGPPLQPSVGHDTSSTRDLADLRMNEDRVFASLGWTVDHATGLPAVPTSIVQAVAARTVTSRPTTTQPTTQEGTR